MCFLFVIWCAMLYDVLLCVRVVDVVWLCSVCGVLCSVVLCDIMFR